MKSINKIWKRIAVILFFYLINFGLWELIAPIISDEWASFVVYVILFFIVIVLFHRELKEEWDFIRNIKLTDKKYYVGLIITLIIELVLTLVMLWIAQNVWVEILPANNENVKNQMASVPSVILTLFYVKHRNVFASIMLHSLINIVGYLSLLIGVL